MAQLVYSYTANFNGTTCMLQKSDKGCFVWPIGNFAAKKSCTPKQYEAWKKFMV